MASLLFFLNKVFVNMPHRSWFNSDANCMMLLVISLEFFRVGRFFVSM